MGLPFHAGIPTGRNGEQTPKYLAVDAPYSTNNARGYSVLNVSSYKLQFLKEIEKGILPDGETGGTVSLPDISPGGQVLPGINQNVDQAQGIFKDVPQGTGTQRPKSREVGTQAEGIRAHVSLEQLCSCLLYTSPSPRDATLSRMPSSA